MEGFPGAELAQAQPRVSQSHMTLISGRVQDTALRPQGGVWFSLGVDVYVGGNPTLMGLCVHASAPALMAERVHECASGYLLFPCLFFLCWIFGWNASRCPLYADM